VTDPNQPDLFGTPPNKRHRRYSAATSRAAAYSLRTGTLERLVLSKIHELEPCISDQVVDSLPERNYQTITPRWSALEEKGFITCGPDERDGRSKRSQRVMRTTLRGREALKATEKPQ